MLLACNKPAGIKLKDSLCDFCWAEIWLPIIVMPHKIGLATLQRLSGLLPSNASPEDKMEVAEMVADSRTRNVVAETKQKELKKKLKLGQHLKHPSARFVGVSQRMHTPRPKALNAIKQEKLASRQEMKAVMNALSHVGMSMDSFFPKNPLTPKVRDMEERQVLELNSQKFAFIYNKHGADPLGRSDALRHTGHPPSALCRPRVTAAHLLSVLSIFGSEHRSDSRRAAPRWQHGFRCVHTIEPPSDSGLRTRPKPHAQAQIACTSRKGDLLHSGRETLPRCNYLGDLGPNSDSCSTTQKHVQE